MKSGGVYTALAAKQDALTIDSAPTASSANPVSSGGVYTALAGKQNALTFDDAPTANSSNPVKSGGVKTAIDAIRTAIMDVPNTAGTYTLRATRAAGSADPVFEWIAES